VHEKQNRASEAIDQLPVTFTELIAKKLGWVPGFFLDHPAANTQTL